jgi:hypothetical protein
MEVIQSRAVEWHTQHEPAQINWQFQEDVVNSLRSSITRFSYCELFERVEVVHHEGLITAERIKYERRDLLDVWLEEGS